MLPNFKLAEQGKYKDQLNLFGVTDFHELLTLVKDLPYGRTSSRGDFLSLFLEKRGTCSLKHALLAEVALLNGHPEIELVLGIFLMGPKYSPKIRPLLESACLEHIPEAHCYLRYQNQRYDFTTSSSSPADFEPFLVREQRCEPQQVVEWKPMIHQHYLEAWSKRKKLNLSLTELWELREKCIHHMKT